MEWARHRFRFRKGYTPTYTKTPSKRTVDAETPMMEPKGSKIKIKQWKELKHSVLLLIIVVFTVTDLPNRVSSASTTNSNFNFDRKSFRQILHRSDSNNASDNNHNPIPDASIESNFGQEVKVETQEHKIQHKGHGKDDETQRIQDILRDIFLDEFAPNDDPGDDEVEELKVTSLHRIGDPHSRQRRSEGSGYHDQPLFPEVGRSSRGGKRGSPSKDSSETETSSKRKKSSSATNNKGRNKSKKSSGSDIGKYNGYMDAVLTRMNAMIKKKRMDPLRVNLYAGASKTPAQANKGSKKQKSKGNQSKKHSARMDLEAEGEDDDEDVQALDEDDDYDHNGPARKDIFLNSNHHEEKHDQVDDDDDADTHDQLEEETARKIRSILENISNGTTDSIGAEEEIPRGNDSKPKKPKGSNSNRNKESSNKDKSKTSSNGKNKKSQKGSSESSSSSGSSNKNKNKQSKQRPTRGILHGLSTLKRDGNVAVIKQGDKVRIVRANFLLGPVSLEIMPRKSKSEDPDSKAAATATAPKLRGVLEVRLKKGSPTRIRKLRVYPPKNVKVNSASGSLNTGNSSSSAKNKKPQQYGKVTPMATARLRQIATTVVRQTDKALKAQEQGHQPSS